MPRDTGEELADSGGEGLSRLQKVASLPWDMKTENEMLRSRLEEQSQLICLLKQRADETLRRCQCLEKGNAELEERCEAERKRGDQLDERFELLAANHQQMMRFKDEYKTQNEELRAECERLRGNIAPQLLEKDRSIQELSARLQAMEREQKEKGLRHEGELEAMREKLGMLSEDSQGKTQELAFLSQKLESLQEVCHKAQQEICRMKKAQSIEQTETEKLVSEMNKEKQELLHLCMERGRTLQERQKEVTELTERLQESEKAYRLAEERYQKDAAAVNADARVAELHKRLEENEKELVQLRREFEAYKTHSGNLLSKERDLNAKLRHLIG
ncbi:coiled-coil domain-containing protein 89 [Spea bombifrons]|uniref:coiled-coil domain-containing protein 89 n=1 Tax=Spea bombifrons TaxID=233779 RepID=UPI00234B1826|nr:coiled-coil domain-containing protein 89 [Spea bombifrons]